MDSSDGENCDMMAGRSVPNGGYSMTTQQLFDLFLYATNWDLGLNLIFITGAILYLLVTGRWRNRFPGNEPVSGKQKVLFLTGWLIYYFAMGSPLQLLAHELFSMHMMQMSLLFFVVPPLLLLGMPADLLRMVFRNRVVKAIFSFFTRPVISLFFFNVLIWFYHVPVIFDAIMGSHLLHYVSHGLLMFAAVCTWWPIIAPLPEMDRLKPLMKLGLIVGNSVLLTPACALIIFTDVVLFRSFAEMSTLVPVMSPIQDQQLGGVIMKIMQEIVYIFAICLIFIKWIREERAKDQAEMEKWKNGEVPRIENG
jgi:putative membrane protein